MVSVGPFKRLTGFNFPGLCFMSTGYEFYETPAHPTPPFSYNSGYLGSEYVDIAPDPLAPTSTGFGGAIIGSLGHGLHFAYFYRTLMLPGDGLDPGIYTWIGFEFETPEEAAAIVEYLSDKGIVWGASSADTFAFMTLDVDTTNNLVRYKGESPSTFGLGGETQQIHLFIA